MQVRPQDCSIDPVRCLKHVVMVVPVNPEEDKTEDVGQKVREYRPQCVEIGAVRSLELEHHDGNQNCDDTITERFEP
jgi:hypothetical protein